MVFSSGGLTNLIPCITHRDDSTIIYIIIISGTWDQKIMVDQRCYLLTSQQKTPKLFDRRYVTHPCVLGYATRWAPTSYEWSYKPL